MTAGAYTAARIYARAITSADERLLRGEIHFLKERLIELENALAAERKRAETLVRGASIRTTGLSLPATGRLIEQAAVFGWVWFDGCDEPVTWPLKYLEAMK